MPVEELPPAYVQLEPLEFASKPIVMHCGKAAKYVRLMNLQGTIDYLYITDAVEKHQSLDFRLYSEMGPIIFNIQKLNNTPTFLISDLRSSESIRVTRECHAATEKYRFHYNRVTYAWKTLSLDDFFLTRYPQKDTIATLRLKKNFFAAMKSQMVGNVYEFIMEGNHELYHIAFLTAFTVNWEYRKRKIPLLYF